MKITIVGIVAFICTMLASRGLLFAVLFYSAWDLTLSVFTSTPWSTLLSLQHFWNQVAFPCYLGGMMIGTFVGCVAAIIHAVNGQLPSGFSRLLLRAIPNMNSSSRVDSEQTFQYKSDLFLVVLVGTAVGSLAPAVMYALRHIGCDIGDLAEDPTLPIVTGALGAICSTVFECTKVWRAEEKEKRLAVNAATEGLASESNMREKVDMAV
jgi:hypothetical protein